MSQKKNMKNMNMNINIPENMIDQLQQFLATLNVQGSTSTSAPAEIVKKQDERYRGEVVHIKAHKVDKQGKFSFHVVWKDNSSQWVDDDECDCEYLISNYLRSNKINTAYLFCRVSTPDQAKSTNLSLDAQKDELLNSLAEFDTPFQRIRVYQISGSAYYKIPWQLQEIGNSAGFGDAILVWRVDRLSRNIECSMEWLLNLDRKHVAIYSHQEKLQFAKNKLAFYQALLDAHKEAHLLGERVRLAFKRKRERGDEHIGRLSFGKKYCRVLNADGTTKKMAVVDDNEEKSIIQRIKSSKQSTKELAEIFNKQGITKRGRKWNNNMVKNLRSYKKV